VTDSTNPPLLVWGAATDAGRVRQGNEDSYVAEAMVFGVADGMGGHQAGEVASAIAAGTLRDRLVAGAASVDVAVATVVEANAAIFQGAHSNVEQRGMGTTLTALCVLTTPDVAPRFALVNVGDSRTYVWRNGRLRRVSIDHSYVQELVSTGHITELEARNHPRRNIVTRALGIEPNVRVDTWVLPLVRGDRYVLCSDGLVDEVDDNQISAILATNAHPQAAADALVEAANHNGGRDNTTVSVVDVLDGADPLADTADLELDPTWAEEQPDRLIDADPQVDDTMMLALASPSPGADTEPGDAPRGRRGLGVMLFVVAIVAIVVFTVTLVLVVRHNSSNTPATTVPSSTVPPSTSTSTTSTTSTTTPPSTAVGASSAPSSSAGP
jgi:serine/threonine protein phosphatase PrpC